jgi:hypothetical protein
MNLLFTRGTSELRQFFFQWGMSMFLLHVSKYMWGIVKQELDGVTGDKVEIGLGPSEEVTPYFLCLWIGLLCA